MAIIKYFQKIPLFSSLDYVGLCEDIKGTLGTILGTKLSGLDSTGRSEWGRMIDREGGGIPLPGM